MEPVRLNVGAGPEPAAGWVNVDVKAWPGVAWERVLGTGVCLAPEPGNYLADASTPYGLPWQDGTFEGAVAHHVLQMVAYPDLVPWLAEVRRVLRPLAWLRMTLPDLLGAMSAASQGDYGWFPISDDLEPLIDGKLCLYISQAGATRSVFTVAWAMQLCERAGFTQVHGHGSPTSKHRTRGPGWLTELDSRLNESIVVEAMA